MQVFTKYNRCNIKEAMNNNRTLMYTFALASKRKWMARCLTHALAANMGSVIRKIHTSVQIARTLTSVRPSSISLCMQNCCLGISTCCFAMFSYFSMHQAQACLQSLRAFSILWACFCEKKILLFGQMVLPWYVQLGARKLDYTSSWDGTHETKPDSVYDRCARGQCFVMLTANTQGKKCITLLH